MDEPNLPAGGRSDCHGLLAAGLSQESTARALFDSVAVPQKQIAVLAQPIGRAQWKLLVLEQIKAQPHCWRARQDGLVGPRLNRLNHSGTCKRYLNSNGYSLRSGGQDLGTRFRFRLKPSGASLRLEPLDPQQRAPLLVGQAAIPARRDPNRFVALQLEPSRALLGTPDVPGSPVEPPVLRASRPDEPAANAGQQCPDPAGGNSLSPLRTNHHSAS